MSLDGERLSDDQSVSETDTANSGDSSEPTAVPAEPDGDGDTAEQDNPGGSDSTAVDGGDDDTTNETGGTNGPEEGGTSDTGGDDDTSVAPPTEEVDGTPGTEGLADSYYPDMGNGGYDVELYNLVLDWNPDSKVLSGFAEITATATQDLSAFNLDFVGMDISAISVNGEAATFERVEPELTVQAPSGLAQGTEFVVVVEYSGQPKAVPARSNIGADGWVNASGVTFVAGEPGGASGWFPVNDHPLDKALYRYEMTVPSSETVATNGLLVEERNNGDTITWVYETRFPQASYLTTMVIGDIELVTTGEVNGIVIRHALASSRVDEVLPQLESTEKMLNVLADMFGPYPFEVYGIAMVNTDLGFALETQTLSIFGTDFLSGGNFQSVLVHELAHQWFGDSISVADWSEIWLNEGFATYAQYLYEEAVDPNYDIDLEMDRFTRFGASAVVSPPPGDPGHQNLFASTVYLRGALTLHALRLTIGDDAFFEFMKTYVERHTGGNVRTTDLIAVAEEVSGQELDAFFNAWLYEGPLPALPGS